MRYRINQEMIELYRQSQIDPGPCNDCGQDEGNWQPGYDRGDDPDYVGFQCRGCGHITGIQRWKDEDEEIQYETAHGRSADIALTDSTVQELADEAAQGYDIEQFRTRRSGQ